MDDYLFDDEYARFKCSMILLRNAFLPNWGNSTKDEVEEFFNGYQVACLLDRLMTWGTK